MKRKSSSFFIIILLLVAVLTGIFLFFQIEKTKQLIEGTFSAQLVSAWPRKEKPKIVRLIFVGDIMLDRGVEYRVKKEGKGFEFPFMKIKDFLIETDILFGNLESVVSDQGKKMGSIYSFRAEPQALEGLAFAGFDVLSLANNHAFDYGRQATEDSFSRLRKSNIDPVGAGFSKEEAHSPIVKEIEGYRIAFLAYNDLCAKNWMAGEDFFGIACLEEGIEEDIKSAKARSEMVIVSLHFGEEYQLKSNSEQKKMAHLAIDSGADLVVGHHPHVVQEVENYKGRLIFYSLGNFIFDQDFSKDTQEGLAVMLEIGKGEWFFRLFPIQISNAQPSLMLEEAKDFLESLAKRSDSLKDSIGDGFIKIKLSGAE